MNRFRFKSAIASRTLLAAVLLVFARQAQTQDRNSSPDQEKPVHILDTRADFSGWTGNNARAGRIAEIKIGLFMPIQNNEQAVNAASLAAMEINQAGGILGKPIRLITRWAASPWSAGSKEMIRLIYTDSVWAIIGSVDGTATHIAEQIVTKARLPLISPLSADPTLTYVNIPWMFRLPPDYNSQARVIVNEGTGKLKLARIGLITSTDHDGRVFAKSLLDAMQGQPRSVQFHLEVPPQSVDFEMILSKMNQFSPDGLVIHIPAADLLHILAELAERGSALNIFIPWIPELKNGDLARFSDLRIYYIEPYSGATDQRRTQFVNAYNNQFDGNPAPAAAYTYDAVYLVAEALKRGGLDRVDLRQALAETEFAGVTGMIKWDNGGGNQVTPLLRLAAEKTVPALKK